MMEERVFMYVMAKAQKPRSIKFEEGTIPRIQAWIAAQRVKPTVSAVIKQAVDEFLERAEKDKSKK